MFLPIIMNIRGLAILGEDAVKADLGDSTGLDQSHFLGHGPCLVEIHVEGWRNSL
jgi:hypothetical protein